MLCNFLNRIIEGNSFPREYLGVDYALLKNSISIYAGTERNQQLIDITDQHLFLGYSPVIVGIYFRQDDGNDLTKRNSIFLQFISNELNGLCIAELEVERISEKRFGGYTLVLFKGKHVTHKLLPTINQQLIRLKSTIEKKPKGNVTVPGNQYDQVRVMYTVPRLISLVTVGDENTCNIFPTDLHGKIGSMYVDSLRLAGKASNQVNEKKKVVLSRMHLQARVDVYAMGKNHMKDMQPSSSFNIREQRSDVYHLPIPQQALSYIELQQVESIEIGIHRLHFFTVMNEYVLENDAPQLACIHKFYAQWRLDKRLPLEYV